MGDFRDLFVRDLLALIAEALGHRDVEVGSVDELDFALALRRLLIGDDPYIGRNAGIVKHVRRQSDDGFEIVAFDDPAADFAFPALRAARKKGRPVEHDR